MTIPRSQVMPLLLAACPSFQKRWDAFCAESPADSAGLYLPLGKLARHLVDLVGRGETGELPAVFAVVERLHVEGDAAVQEAATLGLLESLQNIARHRSVSPEALVPFLGPQAATWWHELDRFWNGEVPYVGAGVKPRAK